MAFLEEHGQVPDAVRDRVEREEDLAVLREWMKRAARVRSMQEFEAYLTEEAGEKE